MNIGFYLLLPIFIPLVIMLAAVLATWGSYIFKKKKEK